MPDPKSPGSFQNESTVSFSCAGYVGVQELPFAAYMPKGYANMEVDNKTPTIILPGEDANQGTPTPLTD